MGNARSRARAYYTWFLIRNHYTWYREKSIERPKGIHFFSTHKFWTTSHNTTIKAYFDRKMIEIMILFSYFPWNFFIFFYFAIFRTLKDTWKIMENFFSFSEIFSLNEISGPSVNSHFNWIKIKQYVFNLKLSPRVNPTPWSSGFELKLAPDILLELLILSPPSPYVL